MKGSQVIEGAGSTTTETAAQTARTLAKKLGDEGKPVIANIGGTGAPHEPVDAININNQAVPRKSIPNHVLADGADIGELLEPGTVDRVEGHNKAPRILDWERAAPGVNRVLKSGGKVNYYVRGADPDLELAAQKLRDLGWKDVITKGAGQAALVAVRDEALAPDEAGCGHPHVVVLKMSLRGAAGSWHGTVSPSTTCAQRRALPFAR